VLVDSIRRVSRTDNAAVRFLFTTLAGSGHFHPLVPPAKALEQAGHVVAFAAPSSFRASIERSGFQAYPAGFDRPHDGADDRFLQLTRAIDALPPDGPARTLFRIRDLFAGLYAERMIPDLLAIADEWRPDAIVRDVGEFGAYIAAEVLDIPHATVRSNTMLSTYSERHIVSAQISRLRAAYGLAPDPDSASLFRYLHLAFEPPHFHDPALPLAPTSHLLRPIPFDQSGDEILPAWVAGLPPRPTVYATLGTAFNRRVPELFKAILDGLRTEPVNLILTVGRDGNPAELGPQADGTHVERYVPQNLLFPHCALVVCHAGFSTVTASLSHGLPMVTLAIDADQPVNAHRCSALGVAEVIEYGLRTPESIRDAVRRVLDTPGYRLKAEAIRDEMVLLPGPDHAAGLLERLAAERQPILTSVASQHPVHRKADV